jgi:hypothetical protein
MVEMLLDWNKDLSKEKDNSGSTPLHFVVSAQYEPYVLLRSFRFPDYGFPLENYPTWYVLDANPSAAYEPDNDGLFPVHITAWMDHIAALRIILKRCPGCIGLRDKRGRTLLHIAVQEMSLDVVRYTCQESLFASIMNAQDNDGNTALHLAVEAGELYVSCALLGNLEVLTNLRNNKNQTPLDLAECKARAGLSNDRVICPSFPLSLSLPSFQLPLHYNPSTVVAYWSQFQIYILQNRENMIYRTVRIAGGKHGSQRWDHFEESTVAAKQEDDEEKESAKMLDSTKSLGIISPLIASATFSATFAIPAGLKARDFTDGAPGLFGTWPFNAFMVAIMMAFIFSLISALSLVYSGMPSVKFPIRRHKFRLSFRMMRSSLTCFAAAFGLGLYMVLTPLGQPTALSGMSFVVFSVPLIRGSEFVANIGIVTSVVRGRRGFWFTCMFLVWGIFKGTFADFCLLTIIVIGGTMATVASHRKDSGLFV